MADGHNIPNPSVPVHLVRLVIDFDTASGTVNVNGPIDNQMFCYGLLEMAKDALRAHAVANQRRVVPFNGPVPVPKIPS